MGVLGVLAKYLFSAMFNAIAGGINEYVENARNDAAKVLTGSQASVLKGQNNELINARIASDVRRTSVSESERYDRLRPPSQRRASPAK